MRMLIQILGTRHRAAIGISQETDAIVLVVSEERKAISLVIDGNVSRDLGAKEFGRYLRNLLASSQKKFQQQLWNKNHLIKHDGKNEYI